MEARGQDPEAAVRFRVRVGFVPGPALYQASAVPGGDAAKAVRIFPHHADTSRLGRWYQLYLPSKKDAARTLPYLQAAKWIEVAELATYPEPILTPNDPDLVQQPHLNATGALAAWDSTRGDTTVYIGVVDTGIDPGHPDLQGNVWLNRREPLNGLDDDRDGVVDNRLGTDLAGADYLNMAPDGEASAGSGGGAGHGVHVTGIATAATNNRVGIAGVGFNTRYLAIKASANNKTTLYKAYEGMVLAADKGAKVINCSFGQSDYPFLGADAVAYCQARGCLVVAGAGNGNNSGPFYPAHLPGVLGIASIDGNRVRSGFSNYGFFTSLCAPGSGIYSTEFGSAYAVRSGTSMATPVVAGAAALVWAYHKRATADQIATRLLASADTTMLGLPAHAGLGQQLGAGALRVDRALRYRGPGFRVNQPEPLTLAGFSLRGPADSIRVRFTVRNVLAGATRQARLWVTCLNPGYGSYRVGISLARMRTGETRTLTVGLRLPANAPDNLSMVLRFAFLDSAYGFAENRVVLVSPTTVDWTAPHFATTSTSNGRLGHLGTFTSRGLGINYRNRGHFYEGGFLLGLAGDTAYSAVRSQPGVQSQDFRARAQVRLLPAGAIWRTEALLSDSGSAVGRGLQMRIRQGAGTVAADSNILLTQAILINRGRRMLREAHFGQWIDWDIASAGMQDVAGYNSALRMIWQRAGVPGIGYSRRGPWYGMLPLAGATAGAAALENLSTSAQPSINDGWTDGEKAALLRSGTTYVQRLPPARTDLSQMVMLGPLTLRPGDSVTVAVAVVFAHDSATLVGRAQAAQRLYGRITAVEDGTLTGVPRWQVRPVPVQDQLTLTLPYPADLTLYALTGATVAQKRFEAGQHTWQLPLLPPGLYVLRDEQGNQMRLVVQGP